MIHQIKIPKFQTGGPINPNKKDAPYYREALNNVPQPSKLADAALQMRSPTTAYNNKVARLEGQTISKQATDNLNKERSAAYRYQTLPNNYNAGTPSMRPLTSGEVAQQRIAKENSIADERLYSNKIKKGALGVANWMDSNMNIPVLQQLNPITMAAHGVANVVDASKEAWNWNPLGVAKNAGEAYLNFMPMEGGLNKVIKSGENSALMNTRVALDRTKALTGPLPAFKIYDKRAGINKNFSNLEMSDELMNTYRQHEKPIVDAWMDSDMSTPINTKPALIKTLTDSHYTQDPNTGFVLFSNGEGNPNFSKLGGTPENAIEQLTKDKVTTYNALGKEYIDNLYANKDKVNMFSKLYGTNDINSLETLRSTSPIIQPKLIKADAMYNYMQGNPVTPHHISMRPTSRVPDNHLINHELRHALQYNDYPPFKNGLNTHIQNKHMETISNAMYKDPYSYHALPHEIMPWATNAKTAMVENGILKSTFDSVNNEQYKQYLEMVKNLPKKLDALKEYNSTIANPNLHQMILDQGFADGGPIPHNGMEVRRNNQDDYDFNDNFKDYYLKNDKTRSDKMFGMYADLMDWHRRYGDNGHNEVIKYMFEESPYGQRARERYRDEAFGFDAEQVDADALRIKYNNLLYNDSNESKVRLNNDLHIAEQFAKKHGLKNYKLIR